MEEKAKKAIYTKWWFWTVLIIIALLIGIKVALLNCTQETSKTNNLTNKILQGNSASQSNIYTTIQDNDGIYKFVLEGNEGISCEGVITLNEGFCKTKYVIMDNATIIETVEREGFCGLSKKDNTTYYFLFKYDANYGLIGYECIRTENGLQCKRCNEYDLIGQSNDELNLLFVNDSKDADNIFENIKEEIVRKKKEQEEAEKKAKAEQEEREFKMSCKTYTFEQMARNPNNFKGTNVKLTGEVIQTLYDSGSVDLRVNITKEGTYSTWYTDTVYVVYYPKVGEDKILEDDIITIYGTAQGDYTYTSAIGTSVTLPLIYGKYITIE